MRRIIAIMVLGVLLTSCSGAGDTDDSATATNSATTQAATGNIDGKFDVGGHKLHLACKGSGSPTIVYLHGLDPAARPVAKALERSLRWPLSSTATAAMTAPTPAAATRCPAP